MYNEYREWWLTIECIPIMIEAFKHGTTFYASDHEWEGDDTGERFQAKLILMDGRNFIRVTNDERRRLLPILQNYLETNRC